MTRADLSPNNAAIYDALPNEELRGLFLEQCELTQNALVRAAIPAIMARNFSHNIGNHVMKLRK